MDNIDKKILQFLLKDGRMPQKRIADELGISAQALKYRFRKLLEDGVIKRFVLHVSPDFYGKNQGFAAFRTDQDYDVGIFSRFKCLEDVAIFGFHADDEEKLKEVLKRAYEELGKPVMNYVPPVNPKVGTVGETDLKVIELLKEEPRMPVSSIAKAAGISASNARKRVDRLREKRIASVIPILDLSKTDAVIYLLFSNSPSEITPIVLPSLIFQISDGKSGIAVCFSDSLESAKKKINSVRKVDVNSQVMVVYDYDFLT